MKLLSLLAIPFLLAGIATAKSITLKNDQIARHFELKDDSIRTTSFTGPRGKIEVESDEFHFLTIDGKSATIADYKLTDQTQKRIEKTQELRCSYQLKNKALPLPQSLIIRYTLHDDELVTRKTIAILGSNKATIDRLEVERFSLAGKASFGGRGQPVFSNGWFFGLEYPAGHSRHTNGNTPEADTHHFEMAGNYSWIGLDGKDQTATPRDGLIRLFHFPGKTDAFTSKTAVAGTANKGISDELAFLDYIRTISKKPRTFLHYNNWFDPAGKNLRGDNFVNVWRQFKKITDLAGIKMHSMVPDNGWQNRSSIYQPSKGHFPNEMKDLAKLGDSLRKEGTALGLWHTFDNTQNNIGWAKENGYPQAVANKYFKQYFPHQCLGHEGYLKDHAKQLKALVKQGQLSYLKHDFNHLCCQGEGHGHLPTDRHGHEANVDGMIHLINACRETNPEIYQNLTNWMWYSPWWFMHGDAIWMLAGDDGFNANTPEISYRAMATTDRDVYLWRMFAKQSDRPIFSISRLMTHGIVKNHRGQMQAPTDTLQDWADHVIMHYGRGTQMKEWYITPSAMKPEEWKILLSTHKWSEKNFNAFKNTLYIGGRPDDGYPYGYIGWDGDKGILVVRNPAPEEKVLEIPVNEESWYRGELGKPFHAKVVYPYTGNYPENFTTGKTMKIRIPGYQTLALELHPGEMSHIQKNATTISVAAQREGNTLTFTVPDQDMTRCELLVIGRPNLPSLQVSDHSKPTRTSKGKINAYPGYARHGMPSEKAEMWAMAGYDMLAQRGKEARIRLIPGMDPTSVDIWLLIDSGKAIKADYPADSPWPISDGFRRSTHPLLRGHQISGTEIRAPKASELEKPIQKLTLTGQAFGVNGGEFGENDIYLNGKKIGKLPTCGDAWKKFSIDLPADTRAAQYALEIRNPNKDDKYKVRKFTIVTTLSDGTPISTQPSEAYTRDTEKSWTHFEGTAFAKSEASGLIILKN